MERRKVAAKTRFEGICDKVEQDGTRNKRNAVSGNRGEAAVG